MGLMPTSLVCPLLTHRRHSPDTTQYTVHPQYHVLHHYNASDNNNPSASSPPPKTDDEIYNTGETGGNKNDGSSGGDGC
jgi:hypothetical protein